MKLTSQPYPAYKPSGVEWLGDVPRHWEVRRLRNILTGTNERNRPDLPLLSVVRERGVILRDITDTDENHNFVPDDLSNYKVVQEGQFAMNKMKAWQGSYGVSRHDGIVSPAYYVFDIQEVAGTYLHVTLRSKAYVPFFAQASDGVRIGQWDLSPERMRQIPLLVPPLPEQRAIVRYLDHTDHRIRRYADRQAETHHSAGGGEAGCHPPRRHPRPRTQRPPQALRRRVARRCAGSIGRWQSCVAS